MDALPQLHVLFGAIAASASAAWAASLPALPRVTLGRRGERRKLALDGSFRHIEPLVRWLGARCSALPLPGVRAQLDAILQRSGSFLGLDANELLALCALGAAASVGLAYALISRVLGLWIAVSFVLGALAPVIAVLDHKRGRDRRITRQLPAALDVFTLALHAGFDFAGSVALVASSLIDADDPLRDELRLLQQELAMGSSRERALRSLAARCDVPAIQDLVRVVIQAERKGTALAAVLDVQAQVARNRRSVLAEEAAARASILLLGPLMLIVLALLLLLLAPLAIRSL